MLNKIMLATSKILFSACVALYLYTDDQSLANFAIFNGILAILVKDE